MIQSRHAQYIRIDNRDLVIFSSNDYLGLSHHPDVLKAAREAGEKYGYGTGGAPGTSGTTVIHQQLAAEIARFKHRDKAIIFPSGYAANISLHQSLTDNNTIYFCDERNHPSAADGIKLAGCDKQIYKHLDYEHLENLLRDDNHVNRIVTTCSVFTIDGAICPLEKLIQLKAKYGFILIIDEAHATGCLGKTGRGLEEHCSLEKSADFIMGTFSKALGSQGGFITYSGDKEELLRKPLRSFEYSTSIATPSAAASLEALKILQARPELVQKMRSNISQIYEKLKTSGFELNGPHRHIVNVYFGSEEKTVKIIENLQHQGYFVVPISLDSRWGLRLTAMAVHADKEIDDFCRKLTEIETNYQ
jgi:8-amino-7-oxononanoate synthase